MRTTSHGCRAIGSLLGARARARARGAALFASIVGCSIGAAQAQVPFDVDRSNAKAAEGSAAEEPASEADASRPEPVEATPAPGGADVGLDQLLRLPNSLDFKEERRGGGGAADWRRRFTESEQAVNDARARLEQAEGAMAEAGTSGSGQWQIAPPGQQASADTGPLSFRLREDLRRAREALDQAERRHRALIVEADLAGVPEAWRQTGVR